MVLKRNPDIIPDLGGGENYRVLKHGPNLLKRLCSLGREEITGLSNSTFQPQAGLEGDRITGLSTIVNGQLYWVWKGMGLYGTQTAE